MSAHAEKIAHSKTIDEQFIDWESHVFGFGYGTGEEHTLTALKRFFELFGHEPDRPNSYSYEVLEASITPTVAWLMINILCHADIIEYGTSPRYGWLTRKGEALKAYLASKSVSELENLVCSTDEDYAMCGPDTCNCAALGSKCTNAVMALA